MPTIVAVIVLGVLAVSSVRQAAVWRDELSLWTAAVQQAPDKPRPHLQLVLALLERRRFTEAAIVLDDTERILTDLDIRLQPWDRSDATIALRQNRALWARLTGGRR